MPQYTYKAKSGPGTLCQDVMAAESRMAVVRKLRQQGLFPVEITEIDPSARRFRQASVSRAAVAEFTRQLANLMHAGFSLPNALSTLQAQYQEQRIKALVGDLHERVRK